MFRKKAAPQPEPTPMIQERPGAKNRPTPKRRDQEAANKRPLVGNAKAAKSDVKTRQRAEREQVRQGMLRGEEKYLPKRDQGGAKRLARDIVDARWNIGEFLLPLMLIVLALMLFAGTNPRMQLLILPLVYGVMAIGVLDAWFLTRRVKKRVTEEFDESAASRLGWYVALRSLQMRMSRVPRPQIKRGEPVVAHRR